MNTNTVSPDIAVSQSPAALPLHNKISELLAREIAAGHWRVGERLPPESVLATTLNVAVGTLRKALAVLEQDGAIERKQGSGTYVKQAPKGKGVYDLFRLELAQGGGLPTAVNLEFVRLPHPDFVPAFVPTFGLEQRASCYRLRRLRLLNNTPIALEEIYFDTRHNNNLTINDLGEALYLFYQTKLHFWIASATDRLGMSAVPAWSPSLFKLAAGAPCGYIERESWSGTDTIEEFSRTWFDASACQYVSRLK